MQRIALNRTDVRTSPCGGPRTPAAPLSRRPRRTGARRGGISRSIASPSSEPKRSLSIALVAATAAREVRENTSIQCSMRASSASGAISSVANPCRSAQAPSRGSPPSSSSRAALSPSTSGSSSVPALLATRPMPTSGVISSTRSVQRRRSQLAANSSAPPTHTPSTAAIAGTAAASTTRVSRWKPSMVAAQAAESASSAEWRSSPAEKWSPAPRSTMQRTWESALAASIASAIAVIVSRSQALRRAWRSHEIRRPAPRSAVVTVMWRSPS